MARQAQQNAQNTYNTAGSVVGSGINNAQSIFNQLMPQYQAEINNPTGIGASGLAAEETAGEQSTGGAVAGATGQGNLLAARTRNLGSQQSSNNASAENAMRVNSQNAVQDVAQNERLKQEQKASGLAGEAGLYGQNMNEILGGLGAETGANNSLLQAGQSGWLQNMEGILQTLGGLGASAAGAAGSLGVKA